MALTIKHDEAAKLAQELARLTGESLTEAVLQALRERLKRESDRRSTPGMREEVTRIQARIARLPHRDTRRDEELIGYDNSGLPS